MSKYIEDILKYENEKGVIRVNGDGLRIRQNGGMFYFTPWDEIFQIRSLKQSVKRLNDKGIDIDKDIRLEYPQNILKDLGVDLNEPRYEYGKQYYLDADSIIADFECNLKKCCLTPREENCLLLYYKSLMTLEEVGKEFCVQRERARQIISRAMRRLMMPKRLNLLLEIPFINYQEALRESIAEETRKFMKEHETDIMANMSNEIVEFYNRNKFDERQREKFEDELIKIRELEIPIEKLDLSIRSYNCLKRVGITTVKELVECIIRGDLVKIRNLGKKSSREIINRLIDEGYIQNKGYGNILYDGCKPEEIYLTNYLKGEAISFND